MSLPMNEYDAPTFFIVVTATVLLFISLLEAFFVDTN